MKKVDFLKEGEIGDWKIEHFEINDKQARMFNLQQLFSHHPDRSVAPGKYTKLIHKKRGVIMSDTPAEMNDHAYFVEKAYGNVLINGLGLGVVLYNCVIKEEVKHVTVVEIDRDVIELVGSQFLPMFENKIKIVHANALTYTFPREVKFNCVWHDIWDSICLDNWDEYKALHRKYGKRCEFQYSWGRDYLLRQKRESRQMY